MSRKPGADSFQKGESQQSKHDAKLKSTTEDSPPAAHTEARGASPLSLRRRENAGPGPSGSARSHLRPEASSPAH